MLRLNSRVLSQWCLCSGLLVFTLHQAAAQSPDALTQFFEAKQITVKLDMPGTQKGIDIIRIGLSRWTRRRMRTG